VGATSVGVGAIVGGGILVLAGVAFKATGPSAVLAFALNGALAFITALSFAELASLFPESGGAYTFAKKVLSLRAAFAVGWVLWFSYIVAAVLYAVGFSAFAVELFTALFPQLAIAGPEAASSWATSRGMRVGLAALATLFYMAMLIRKSAGGGQWATIGKTALFALLILVGVGVALFKPFASMRVAFTPFLSQGPTGLIAAMGFTFIALQGFDLIAAVGGEVRSAERNVPRAMFLSLGVALAVYLPLLAIVAAVGTGEYDSIAALADAHPDTAMAVAVRNYMGPIGYYAVVVAAVLSTLSALHANLLGASRVAWQMAHDRMLPHGLVALRGDEQTPAMAIYTSTLAVLAIVLVVADLSVAGAAASLVFLIAFALAHVTAILARHRLGKVAPFTMPGFPWLPGLGACACSALALWQMVAVPKAGALTLLWVGLGLLMYNMLFAQRATAVDAFLEASDPNLARIRGHSHLVLAPVANPATAPGIIAVANAMAPPGSGRVLLLAVMPTPTKVEGPDPPETLTSAQRVLEKALTTSLISGYAPEALLTIAPVTWTEIGRVARAHRCESVLLGFSRITKPLAGGYLEDFLNQVDYDVAFLRAPESWRLESARRILVPFGGKGSQDTLRARVLGSLARTATREFTFLRVLPEGTPKEVEREARTQLLRVAEEETPSAPRIELIHSNDVVATLKELSPQFDLVILGLQQLGRQRIFGGVASRIAHETDFTALMLSRRP
jgi:amino acid transporter